MARLIRIFLKELIRFALKKPFKFIHSFGAMIYCGHIYFRAQRQTKNRVKHFVDNAGEDAIPYNGKYDFYYLGVFIKFVQVLRMAPGKYIHLFSKASLLAEEVFLKYPTTVKRTAGVRSGVKLIQKIDKSLNCCPSLHVAYAVLLFNIANTFKDKKFVRKLQTFTVNVLSSILYLKQHAMIDISTGILCAKIAWEDTGFNDLTSVLKSKHIDYGQVKGNYFKALKMYEEKGNFLSVCRDFII